MINANIIKDIAAALKASEKKTSAYDTTAKVKRIEGSTAWVHITGGVDETPVRMTINAEVGDTVQVRVSGGSAFLVGNVTAPPTDDKKAKIVEKALDVTMKVVHSVQEVANEASKIASATRQYFWFEATGGDTGAHISETPQDEWYDPDSPNYHSGPNLLANSNGVAVRNGITELATFSSSLVELGKNSLASVIEMCAGKLKILASVYSAVVETAGEYDANNPLSFYNYLLLKSEHTKDSDSSAASIDLWASAHSGYSRVNVYADIIGLNGKTSINSGKGISSSDDVLTHYPSTNITDANDAPRMTDIRFGNSHGVTHMPVSNACFLITIGSSDSNKIQFCTAANVDTTTLYMRKCSSGTWGTSWKSISFS